MLLATSGGQDSACLTAIVSQLLDQWRWNIGAISCNHLWQEDSLYALFHVARVSFWAEQKVFFATAPREVGSEARARGWRYNTIYRIARLYGYEAFCTGQTGSDRVETALFNSFRGSGARGLSPLAWNRFFVASYPERLYLSGFLGTSPCQRLLLFSPPNTYLRGQDSLPVLLTLRAKRWLPLREKRCSPLLGPIRGAHKEINPSCFKKEVSKQAR